MYVSCMYVWYVYPARVLCTIRACTTCMYHIIMYVMYIHTYMYVMYIQVHTGTYMYVHTYIHTYMTYMYVYYTLSQCSDSFSRCLLCASTRYPCTHTHTQLYIIPDTRLHVCMYIHVSMYVHVLYIHVLQLYNNNYNYNFYIIYYTLKLEGNINNIRLQLYSV